MDDMNQTNGNGNHEQHRRYTPVIDRKIINFNIKLSFRMIIETGLFIFLILFFVRGTEITRLKNAIHADSVICNTNNVWESNEFIVTEYTLAANECGKSKDHPQYGITYSGRRAKVGVTVAVDPKVIPEGSILIADNGHIYIAEDRGSRVLGEHVDIFIGTGTTENIKKADTFGLKKHQHFRVIEQGR